MLRQLVSVFAATALAAGAFAPAKASASRDAGRPPPVVMIGPSAR